MILDNLSNIGRYAALSAHFGVAADFLARDDLDTLPVGRHEIDGNNGYILSQENILKPHGMAYEAHARYADIQVVLSGEERMGWGAEGRLGELDEERDFMACHEVAGETFIVRPGQFVIFLPGEMHAPGYPAGDEETVCRKLVVKVRCMPE